MRGLYQPVSAGLMLSSAFAVLFFLWIVVGGLLERDGKLADQNSKLFAQREDLLRQLTEFESEGVCESTDRSDTFFEGMLPPLGESRSFDASVVWIIAGSELGISTGSGLFISDIHVVTNFHVLKDLEPDAVVYVAAHDRGFYEGKLSFYGDSDFGASDLAIITLSSPIDWAKPLSLSSSSRYTDLRLANVVAAGYPGAVIGSYGNFDDMLSGDIADLPQLVLTTGVISSNAFNQLETQIISHTAQISQGSSGGPLIDSCGAVVGINTYIYSDADGVRSFAIGAGTVRSFLDDVALSFSVSSEECDL